MGSTTLTKTIAGTTPTSVVLRDPANAYGVKRTDLSGPAAVVVAAGVAMTAAGGGVYTKTWTDPAPGLTYAWAMRITFDNGQFEDLAGTIAGTTLNTQPTYLDLAAAKALAANLPAAQLPAWSAAADDQRTAALAAATADVDAVRYQGRRYDPTQAAGVPPRGVRGPQPPPGPERRTGRVHGRGLGLGLGRPGRRSSPTPSSWPRCSRPSRSWRGRGRGGWTRSTTGWRARASGA
jgi:hypothetical protein